MKKYRKILIALLVVTIAYVLFDFAYSVSGIYHHVLRGIGGMLFLFAGMFVKDGCELDAEKNDLETAREEIYEWLKKHSQEYVYWMDEEFGKDDLINDLKQAMKDE